MEEEIVEGGLPEWCGRLSAGLARETADMGLNRDFHQAERPKLAARGVERGLAVRRRGRRAAISSALAVLLTFALAFSSFAWAAGAEGLGTVFEDGAVSDVAADGGSGASAPDGAEREAGATEADTGTGAGAEADNADGPAGSEGEEAAMGSGDSDEEAADEGSEDALANSGTDNDIFVASLNEDEADGATDDEGIAPLAETQSVTYLDASSVQQTCGNATVITASDTELGANDGQEHWYVIDGDVKFPSRVTVTGDVRLILKNGVSPTAEYGVTVEGSNKLTIYAQSAIDGTMGRLRALGDGDYAAIGSGRNGTCGTVAINGGHIYATARVNAGIGGGYRSNGGTVEINGGIIEAVGGDGAGIGGGLWGDGGRITINGGEVNATGHRGAGIGGGMDYAGGTITITGGAVNAVGERGAGVGGGAYGAGGNITISGGTVQAESLSYGAGIGGGVRGQGGTITINSGTVTAHSVESGAGIGGGLRGDGGRITINGGIVDATGKDGAGIGGGYQGNGGEVTISGGTVRASGTNGAGIGGGFESSNGGTFVTNTVGRALIFATSIADKGNQADWRGIIFDGDNGKVYGDQTLSDRLSLSEDVTLEIPANTTLTIRDGVAFINKYYRLTGDGTIAPASYKQEANITIADQSQVYSGATFTPTYTYMGNGTVNVKWYADNNGSKGAELPSTPVMPGSYFVGVSAPETGIWKAVPEQTAAFTIEADPDLVGDIKDVTDVDANALSAKLMNTGIDLAQRTLPADVFGEVAIGKDVGIWLKSTDGISDADAAIVEANLNDWMVAEEIDLTLFYRLDGVETQIRETAEPVTVQLMLPDSDVNADPSKTRSYEVVRVHEGAAAVIPAVFDAKAKTLTFDTDKFSAYAVVYKDEIAGEGAGSDDDGISDGSDNGPSGNGNADNSREDAADGSNGDGTSGSLSATGDTAGTFVALLVCAVAASAGVLAVSRRRATSVPKGKHATATSSSRSSSHG